MGTQLQQNSLTVVVDGSEARFKVLRGKVPSKELQHFVSSWERRDAAIYIVVLSGLMGKHGQKGSLRERRKENMKDYVSSCKHFHNHYMHIRT